MENNKRFGMFSSSEDPQKLAKTVEGIIISASSVIVFFLSLKGITVTQAGIAAFAQQIGTIIGAAGTAIGAAITLFGLIRKGIIALTSN